MALHPLPGPPCLHVRAGGERRGRVGRGGRGGGGGEGGGEGREGRGGGGEGEEGMEGERERDNLHSALYNPVYNNFYDTCLVYIVSMTLYEAWFIPCSAVLL